MITYSFHSGKELANICKKEELTIGEVMIRRETAFGDYSREQIIDEMMRNLATMRASVKNGLEEKQNTVTGLTDGEAELLFNHAEKSLMGTNMAEAVAASMAVVEVNASMGKIVAAPTAGASGILPGVLIVYGKKRKWTDEQLCKALFTAGAIGAIIAENASISGAEAGCQAETGSAAAMAAAALVELCGGKPDKALNAAAIALKNVMGLVCDPVAGLVECPCIKRNAIGAANAIMCADMALSGVNSLIPFDEVVTTMMRVGRQINPNLRETALGGLAISPTAKELRKKLGLDNEE